MPASVARSYETRVMSIRAALLALSIGSARLLASREASADPAPATVEAPSTDPTGRGVAVGLENGLWANGFASGLRLRVPLKPSWGLTVRALGVYRQRDVVIDATYTGIGSLEMYGCTPVYLNLLRIYGGGGPRVGYRLAGPGDGEVVIGGGGQAGLEAFIRPWMSFTFELGGTAMTAVTFYL